MIDKKVFEGIIAPMVNPCFEDDSLDMEGVKANLDRLLASDVAGLYINGGTGDAANLSQQERLDIAAYLVPKLLEAGKTAIVHVGQTTQRCAVELAEQAVRLGAQAVASIPPKKPWPQIVEYYKALAATGANVIVYYIPGMTGITATMTELRMMLDIDAEAHFSAKYDFDDIWEPLFDLTGTSLRSFSIPVRPRRCDHMKLRIEGVGNVKIYSITKTIVRGSELS